jgi:hypothetical protein
MKRALVTATLLGTVLLVASPGCSSQGVGDPCTPEQEYDSTFSGFDEKEVSVESKSFQCRTRICLVNHFRGRVSCPYGQSADKNVPAGTPAPNDKGCVTPGTTNVVEGNASDPRKKAFVPAQCVDRNTDKAVYCSCRCADINGNKPSDQTFCECPDGFSCEPLVTSIGKGNEGLTGSYCIKTNTKYDPNTACGSGDCDPVTKKCQ